MMIDNVESLKKVVSQAALSRINGNANISIRSISKSMLNNKRAIGYLFDFEKHLTFNLLESFSHSVWCDADLLSYIFNYCFDYKNIDPPHTLLNVFNAMKKNMCVKLKNNEKFMFSCLMRLHTSEDMEQFVNLVNPTFLDNEKYKERYLKIANNKMLFSMAEKKYNR